MLSKKINSTDMWKIYVDLLTLKEQGSMEMVDLILGHSLYEFDAAHVFINTNTNANRSRLLKPKEEIETNCDQKAYQNNWLDDYYPQRSVFLEVYSLFNLMLHFEVIFF